MRKKVLVIGGIAAAMVLAGGFALAQSTMHGPGGFGPHSMRGEGPGMGPGMHGMMGGGMHGQMDGMRHGGQGTAFADPAEIQDLKAELGITASQEQAWTTYTKALQDAAHATRTTRESVDRDAVGRMTPQDRFAYVSKRREQAQAQQDTLKAAANELLPTLDDRQKEIAEDALPGIVPFGSGMQHGAGMGGSHHR